MRAWVQERWPTIAGVTLLWLVVWQLAEAGRTLTGGIFGYCLDDAYIHLAVAKNLALHHVWGPTRFQFSGASSSPLWVLLLASFPGGPPEWLPLLLALAAASVAVTIAARRWLRAGSSPSDLPLRRAIAFFFVTALVLLVPLPSLALSGMEHCLQIALVFAYAVALERVLAEENPALGWLCLSGALGSACRYEMLLLAFPAGLILLWRSRFRAAIASGLATLLPPAIYGVWSLSHGEYFFPNSVIAKAGAFEFSRGWHQLLSAPHLISALVALLATIVALTPVARSDQRARALRDLCIASCAALLLQVQLGRVGWFFRYEAWLVALAILLTGSALADRLPLVRDWLQPGFRRRTLSICALVLLAIPLVRRAGRALEITPRAMHDIYAQQRQLGLFLLSFPGRSIALNDIGGPSYFADVKILDFVGLGSFDALRAIRAQRTNAQPIGEVIGNLARAHEVEFAFLHEKLFPGVLPSTWRIVGRWRVRESLLLGEDTVTFFATNAELAAELRARLEQFAERLPEDVDAHLAPR
jgi:hypothetical protein